MFRGKLFVILSLALFLGVTSVEACPSCKAANSTDSRLPLAYQASILFMLGVPLGLAFGGGYLLYKLNKVQEAATAAFENGDVWLGDPSMNDAVMG